MTYLIDDDEDQPSADEMGSRLKYQWLTLSHWVDLFIALAGSIIRTGGSICSQYSSTYLKAIKQRLGRIKNIKKKSSLPYSFLTQMALSRQQTTILKDENERLMALETSFTSKSEFLSIVVNTLKRKRNQTYKKLYDCSAI